MPELSVIIPVFNENESLRLLFSKIQEALEESLDRTWEVCFVDDGSTDSSWVELCRIREENPQRVMALRLRRNFGKAEALQAGFEATSGQLAITIDADLQDDPKTIPDFLQKIEEGFDLVSGWKRKRHDPPGKVIPSRVFNAMARAVSGVPIHDFNCGFKAYRREVLDHIRLYGEMHRFTPMLAAAEGFRVTEIEVLHHSRAFGKSKYGARRFLKGLLDLGTVTVMTRFLRRPAHVFGGFGVASFGVGFAILSYLSIGKLLFGVTIDQRPLFFLGILLLLLGVQLVSIGIVAELINYHNRQKTSDHIAEKLELQK